MKAPVIKPDMRPEVAKPDLKRRKKLILKNGQCPGDNVMLAYAVKSLHETHPGRFITDVRVNCRAIFEGNPYITILREGDIGVEVIDLGYPTINSSNQNPVQFVTGFTTELSRKLDIPIWPTQYRDAIFIRDEEKRWKSQVNEIIGRDVPYWVMCCGHKDDYTAKAWSFDRYQELVLRFPNVWFVQVGLNSKGHTHPDLKGDNLIDLVGKTNDRQLIRLVYNSFGTISPVTYLHHLAVAVPAHPRFGRVSRGCITIAGGREPAHWQMAAAEQMLHTCGMLDCCSQGGCWKSRVVAIGDGDKKDKDLCKYPVQTTSGQWVAKCMDMIAVDDVARAIDRYMSNLDYTPKF